MTWHESPLEDATSFGSNRRDAQKKVTRTLLSGTLVLVAIAAIIAVIAFSGADEGPKGRLDLAARDAKLSAAGQHAMNRKASASQSQAQPTAKAPVQLPQSVGKTKSAATAAHATAGASVGTKPQGETKAVTGKDATTKGAVKGGVTTKQDGKHVVAVKKAAASRVVAAREGGDGGAGKSASSAPPVARKAKDTASHIPKQATKDAGKKKAEKKGTGKVMGSEAWERAQDDNFFDSLDKRRSEEERDHLTAIRHKTDHEDEEQARSEAAEEKKVQSAYLDAKKRFAAQRLAAKQYTQRTFAAMENHRSNLQSSSLSDFKSMEAKELATEVERDHPDESATQIAQRAMKLLKGVLKGGSSLPSVPAGGSTGPGPMR
mmetsp:Transcript_61362/g.126714  ORF Transcript_61362/g.126714 Transcript_61362/m.126714 type:complete len:375 (-) Transcript_61362:394-1518(-)|eukprot:CAMPEP_0181318150 /NCGR_PEP_ID=MMETSP1101-20121128/16851_1 /TAXON_ID=46948 /ORGANISM="Rhodomonas abbreviata, Strain Caron Lab Isolate" /LENGTH=374 /DNA_ID=CAMNT_0023425597 /DNA_START=259 /DNA_END=1383 /DNA_ORIENTATION=+